MSDDEYRELETAACDALRELLTRTEPGTGLYLHTAYARLSGEIEASERPDAPRITPQQTEGLGETILEQKARDWCRHPMAQRRHDVLNALGDDRLTKREIHERVADASPDDKVWMSNVETAVAGLWRQGELSREPESFRGKTRYRYFRRTDLDGPIADLDRQFGEESGA